MNHFSFLDLDPRAVGDWMARTLRREVADGLLLAAETWVQSVSDAYRAFREGMDGDAS